MLHICGGRNILVIIIPHFTKKNEFIENKRIKDISCQHLNKSTDYQAIDIPITDRFTIRCIYLTYQDGNTPVDDIKYTPLYRI